MRANAAFRTGDTGGPYRETLMIAGTVLKTSGTCAYQGFEDVYDPKS